MDSTLVACSDTAVGFRRYNSRPTWVASPPGPLAPRGAGRRSAAAAVRRARQLAATSAEDVDDTDDDTGASALSAATEARAGGSSWETATVSLGARVSAAGRVECTWPPRLPRPMPI